MDILEKLNQNTAIKELELTLINANLYENNFLEVVFSSGHKINKDMHDLIYAILKKEVGVFFEVGLQINTPYSDAEVIKNSINYFIDKNYKYIKLRNIIVKTDSKLILLVVESKSSSLIDEKFSKELSQHISENFYLEFEIQIKYEEDKISDLINLKNSFIKTALDAQNEIAFVNISNIEEIYGEIDVKKIYAIQNYKSSTNDAYIAGTITYFSSATTKDKEVDGKIIPGKTYYNFYLNDGHASIRCTVFTNSKNHQVISELKDGMDVICFGKIDEYNSKLSMLVKYIANCTYDIEEKQEFIAPEPEKYITIHPEEYIETNQLSLFSNNDINNANKFLLGKTFVVFDFETTGLEYDSDAITELGAVKIVDGKITETFSTFVNPHMHIPDKISELTHITDEMVKNAPDIEDVLIDFYKFCYNACIVAHNIEFDYKFLKYNASKIGLNFKNKQYDTLLLARNYIKGIKNYKLVTLCDFYNIELIGAHRAVNDCLSTAKLFIKLTDFIKE